MLQAVIFDRDGVLVDADMEAAARLLPPAFPLSLQELNQRWHAWGEKVGFPSSVAEEREFMKGLWDAICDEHALPDSLRHQLYEVDYTRVLVPFPDARPALEHARRFGLKTAVLSNFALASIDASLTAVGLSELVDVAAAATVIQASKPSPEAYRYVTTALGVSPSECLFFDDEPGHVQGARALGMQAYLVDRSQSSHQLSDGVVCDLSALPLLLEATASS